MRISKELREKIETYRRLEREIRQAFIDDDDDNCYMDITSIRFTSEPHGQCQGDGEYCDQWTGYAPDDYHGDYYWETDIGNYVTMHYDM